MLPEHAQFKRREELARHERDLSEGERLLTEAHATIARVTPEVENLRLVVRGLRGLVGVEKEAERGEIAPSPEQIRREARNGAVSNLTYAGRASIPAVIFDVLPEEETSLGDIIERICAHSAFEGRKKPSRGSVTNRLNEMAERGEIIKVRRGAYRLPPAEGAENPHEPGGPIPGVQLVAAKPPGEQLIPAHQGHPINSEGARWG